MSFDGSVLTSTLTIPKGKEFGIRKHYSDDNSDKGQIAWISSTNSSTFWINSEFLGTELAAKANGSNWYVNFEDKATYTYNPFTNKLTVTKADPTPGTGLKFKYGYGTTWTNSGVEQMTDCGNNIWTYDLSMTDNNLEFVIEIGSTDYKPESRVDVILDNEYKLYTGKASGFNFCISTKGDYKITVNAADIDNMTVTVSKAGHPDLDLYIGGNKVGQTVSSTDGKYVWSYETLDALKNIKVDSSKPTVHLRNAHNSNDRYGHDGNVSLNRWVALSHADVSTTIVRELKDVTITANLANNTFKIEGTRVVKTDKPTGNLVYFNAGADYFEKTVMGEQPIYATFIKENEIEPSTTPTLMYDTRDYDNNAMLPMFFAVVPEGNYDGVEFSVTNNGVTHKYNSKKFRKIQQGNNSVESSEDKAAYDADNWWKYIYGCGHPTMDANVSSADQSYITYDSYIFRRDVEKLAVFFAGENLKSGDKTASWNALNLSATRIDDLFHMDFEVIDNAGAEFKMSWIDADTRLTEYNGATGKNVTKGSQRWWATFNTGIVGPTLPPGYTADNLEEAKTKKIYKQGDNNDAVSFIIPRCREYSRYNQWNWWITDDQVSKSNKFTIVIDTKYKTAALIAFKPEPMLENVTLTENAVDVADTPGGLGTQFGNKLLGSESEGEGLVSIDKVNTAKGAAALKVADPTFLSE